MNIVVFPHDYQSVNSSNDLRRFIMCFNFLWILPLYYISINYWLTKPKILFQKFHLMLHKLSITYGKDIIGFHSFHILESD